MGTWVENDKSARESRSTTEASPSPVSLPRPAPPFLFFSGRGVTGVQEVWVVVTAVACTCTSLDPPWLPPVSHSSRCMPWAMLRVSQ